MQSAFNTAFTFAISEADLNAGSDGAPFPSYLAPVLGVDVFLNSIHRSSMSAAEFR